MNETIKVAHVESQVEAVARRLRQVLASSPAILLSLQFENDRLGSISWISDNVLAILGYAPEEVLKPEWCYVNMHPDDRDMVKEQASRELLGKGYVEQEFRFRHANGAYRWARSEIRLIRDDAGQPMEAICAWSDITERKLAEGEQARLREQLQQAQKMESVGRLAGGIAHDFNNLLTVINGYTTLLLRKTNPEDPIREALGEIRLAGERAASLSQQLLTLSRKTVRQPVLVNLNDVATEVRRMLHRVIGEDIRLETRLGERLNHILADPSRIHQVLLNLAVNARDAMPNGGALIIETGNVEFDSAAAEQKGLPAGGYVCLRVEDTGVGIPAHVKPHLFEPFFTTKKPGKGTGLGLATAYSIVKQCGGAIEAQSEVDCGAVFTMYFPNAVATAPVIRAERTPVDRKGNATILLVEDEAQVSRMAARVLVESGFRVLECAHPDRALEYAQSYAGEIALLLTDVVMPDVNGVQLASRILPLRPAMKLVFMSGYSEHAAVDEACLQLGAVYLAKPFTPDDLRAGVFEALAARNGGGTILLVNDEPPVRKVLSEFLTGAGYRVLEAATGADAIKQARVTPVDLMITDLSMPHQEGLETIQQLHREQPQLKMIAISGRFARPMLRAAERFGAKASIGKPVRRDELLQTVSRVFQGDSK